MLKRFMKNKYLLAFLFLFSAGIVFSALGVAAEKNDKEKDNFQKFQKTAILYEKAIMLQGPERAEAVSQLENNLNEIILQTQNDKLASAAFYNAGTVYLDEFRLDKNNSQYLKKAIIYLQESLVKNPNLERAKRNLEIAWREVKENNLAQELGLEPGGGDSDKKKEGEGEGKQQIDEEESGGNEPTKEPLPYSDDEGFGRAQEPQDY